MARFAQTERQALADLLLEVGPAAPTLCTGWQTRDLAGHLVVRERRLDAAAGLVLPPLAGWGERVRARATATAYPELVRRVRHPPWWSPVSNALVDDATNTLEFFVHHEDVRRAQPAWQPRELPAAAQAALWRRVPGIARFALRRTRAQVTVDAPGFGTAPAGAGGPPVLLTGPPGELLIFLSGRQRAARVGLDGPAEVTDRLRGPARAL